VRHRFRLLVAVAVLAAPLAHAQSVVLNSKTLNGLRQRLRTGPPPDVVIDEPLVLTQPETWVVKRLRLQGRGMIYLQQFDLDLTIQQELQSTRTLLGSFLPNSRAKDGKAGAEGSGAPGGAGDDGLNAGNLTLRLPAGLPSRPLSIELGGQSGGNGGKGGSGAPGRSGSPGTPSRSGVFNCVQMATAGAPGERGGDGGDGGPGGACGRGGTVRIDHAHVTYVLLVSANSSPGRGGNGGAPGPGGSGGQGGNGSGFCSGAPSGRRGDPGARGKPGAIGASCIPPEKVDLTPPAAKRKKK